MGSDARAPGSAPPRHGEGVVPDPGPLTPDPASVEEPPPIGRSWSVLYAAVAGTLVVLILLFALFTRAFS